MCSKCDCGTGECDGSGSDRQGTGECNCGRLYLGESCEWSVIGKDPNKNIAIISSITIPSVVVMLAVTYYCYCYKREQRESSITQLLNGDLDSWVIGPKELQLGEYISKGTCGHVYNGYYHNTINVAIKEIYVGNIKTEDVIKFKREALISSRVNHPYIVRFYGICVIKNTRQIFLVSEKCES